jgi:hypothetical protein
MKKVQLLMRIILFLLTVLVFASCKKTDNGESHSTVYISGNEKAGDHTVALYWKNGIAVKLSDGSTSEYSSGIAVSGKNVYVSGANFTGNNEIAHYYQ